MHHQCIPLTYSPLLQRQQPIWCLCCIHRDTRSRWCMRTMLFLPRQHWKMLGGGENSPHQSNISGADLTWCYVVTHSTISWNTRHLNHTNRELKPWTNWWYGFSARWGWLMALCFFAEDTAKTDAASDSRVTMGECLVWGQLSDPNVNQDTIGKLWSRAFYWCNKYAKVLLWNNTLFISKGTKYCW